LDDLRQRRMAESIEAGARASLEALRESSLPRRTGARMALLLSDVEAAFAAGFSRAHVHEALNNSGLNIGFRAFVKSLYRARKKARLATVVPEAQSAAPATQAPRAAVVARTDTPAPGPANAAAPHALASRDLPPARPAVIAANGWKPGSIGEIARSQPDMVGLAKEGRAYAAKLAADKKRKAEEAKSNNPPS